MNSINRSAFDFCPGDVFVGMPIPAPKWIWEGQLAEGCVTLLAGAPKAGKSLFVRNLIRSISNGEPFLDLNTTKSSVAYLALEEHPSFLQKSFKMAGMGTSSIHVHYGPVQTGDITIALNEIRDYCSMFEVRLLIIDPMTKFFNISDANDYVKVYRELSRISHFARDNNIHVLIIHHLNKQIGESTNQILGSTGFFGVSDGAFILKRDGDSATLLSNLRYGNNLSKCVFNYDESGVLHFEGTKSEALEKRTVERIVEYLEENGPMSMNAINSFLKIKKQKLIQLLGEMLSSDQIIRTGTGIKGDSYKYCVPILESVEAEQNYGGEHASEAN